MLNETNKNNMENMNILSHEGKRETVIPNKVMKPNGDMDRFSAEFLAIDLDGCHAIVYYDFDAKCWYYPFSSEPIREDFTYFKIPSAVRFKYYHDLN